MDRTGSPTIQEENVDLCHLREKVRSCLNNAAGWEAHGTWDIINRRRGTAAVNCAGLRPCSFRRHSSLKQWGPDNLLQEHEKRDGAVFG